LVDPPHLDTHRLRELLAVTEVAHVLVVVGGPLNVDSRLGPHEHRETGVATENAYGVGASEGVGNTQFAPPLV